MEVRGRSGGALTGDTQPDEEAYRRRKERAMTLPSRKEFLQACCTLLAAGYAPAVGAMLAGCGRRAMLEPGEASRSQGPDSTFEAGYVALHKSGELERRGQALWNMMENCRLCPRECGASRLDGDRGYCGASASLDVSSFHAHFGEEKPLVGRHGSGTVFFTHCSLRCVFCINWEVSQGGDGERRSVRELADMMLRLQRAGCHNINIVTPTHYVAHMVQALDIAADRGLRVPLVYNTCGWERMEVLQMLDGIVDIYLPDCKYSDAQMAARYSSGAESYPEMTRAGLLEMHRQVGVARPAADGLMYRGLMIRHLVMPNDVSGTKAVVEWIAEHLPMDTYVNIMSQYRPMYRAFDYPEIARRLTRREYDEAVRHARAAGLTNLELQGY
jgi:putative pyruvate formate lyase activating enzyme